MGHDRDQENVKQALEVFEVQEPLTVESLNERYRKLLLMWHPHRYANLTNNPQKYMEMYKKGEARTKDVHAAFKILKAWLEKSNNQLPRDEESSSGHEKEIDRS